MPPIWWVSITLENVWDLTNEEIDIIANSKKFKERLKENLVGSSNKNINENNERQSNLCENMAVTLDKFSSEIDKFNFSTTMRNYWCVETDSFSPSSYAAILNNPPNHDYKYCWFDSKFTHPSKDKKNWYVYDRTNNVVSIYSPLGRGLHTPDRWGNYFLIEIKFKSQAKHQEEIIDSIMKVFDTLKIFHWSSSQDISNDIQNIVKQWLPVLKALKNVCNNFKWSKGVSIDKIVEDYESIKISWY